MILSAAAIAPAVVAAASAGTARAQQFQTADKVAIVTGSSRGIGAATAKRRAKDGFKVVVN
ncbi:short chain dehydrogenase [Rhizobium sp. NFR07]|nr:short chain dehydrogenase [Rhizobium sp. NFR07]